MENGSVPELAAAVPVGVPEPAEAPLFAQGVTVHVVVQRCKHARLLVDEATDSWTEIGRGLVFYLSFGRAGHAGEAAAEGAAEGARGADAAQLLVQQAVKSILTAPLASSGQWQTDHGDAESVIALCRRGEPQGLMVVPQASLVAKLEAGDRNVKYYQQCGKEEARWLFDAFVAALAGVAREQIAGRAVDDVATFEALQAKRAAASLIPPNEYFRTGEYEGKYASFDDRGVPTHTADGAELPKSQVKKLEKLFQAQVKKFAKAQEAQAPPAAEPAKEEVAKERKEPLPPPPLPAGACLPEVRHGTFGGRQGFELVSSGPLTHSFVF